MSQLSEKTLVPVSFILILCGGAAWLTSLHSAVAQIQSKQDRIEAIQVDIATIKQAQADMGERLDRISEFLRSKLR